MRMFGDKEIDFIEDFRMIPSEQIAVIGNEEEIDKIIDIIKISDNWIDSSGKDQLPPDFYNDKDKIMMEVMRVDDHGYKKHGKIINPTYRKENQIRKELEEKGFEYELRDIKTENPTADELRDWWKKSGLPLKRFFNTSGNLYKEMKLKDKLPEMSEEEQINLLASDGMLVKRPILVDGENVLVGFRQQEWEEKH